MDTMTQRFLMFTFIIGAILAVIALPESGFGSRPNIGQNQLNAVNGQINSSQVDQAITTIGNSVTVTTSTSITQTTVTVISGTTTTITNSQIATGQGQNPQNPIQDTCTGGLGLLGQFETTVCNMNIAIHNALIGFSCSTYLKILNDPGCKNIAQAQSVAAQLVTTSPNIFDVFNGGYQSDIHVTKGNNEFIQIFDNPLTQAVSIAVIFLALGILAGLFGAGILANYISRVGIVVSFYYYFNAQILAFGGMPTILIIFLNGIMSVPMIILFYESLGSGQH